MIWTSDPARLAWLAGLTCSYALVCLAPCVRQRRKRQAAASENSANRSDSVAPAWIVAYASQTGNAEQLADQTAAMLRLAGISVRVVELSDLDAGILQRSARILFIVSTYGEGDAPDGAARFVRRVMCSDLPLTRLHYAVLALGDSAYARFCGFGRQLDVWLAGQGAAPLFARVEVDRSASAAIGAWRQQLSHLAGTSDAPHWSGPQFADWRLAARRLLNPGSAGAPLYHLELESDGPARAMAQWQSGDLVQVAAPAAQERPREYSIASIPADGRLHLLVRLLRHADGTAGAASGWLTTQAGIGDCVRLRLHQHKRFRLEGNAARPLILIGNGSGMAGLRGHLKARVAAGQGRNWLLFGERNAAHDFLYRAELEGWQADGMLAGLDMVFSRDQGERVYVQDRLLQRRAQVAGWVVEGAAIYVCGSLDGMAGGVDQALGQILGRPALEALAVEGRYRRDVY